MTGCEPIVYDDAAHSPAAPCWFDGVLFAGVLMPGDEPEQIQYSRRIRLTTNSIVMIDEVNYKVVGLPRQINHFDNLAKLVRA